MNDLQHNKYTEISCLCWETMNRMVKKDLVFPQPKFINIYGQYPDVHFDVNARVIAAKTAVNERHASSYDVCMHLYDDH